MAMIRLVPKAKAEMRTYKAAQLKADMLPQGAKKTAAKARANEFKARVLDRAGK